ncbi:UNKNOWN [Stylonychia lemnae]|uniref:Uncharacterized protein n=1 Tax=Stylonychia lemnae TaxID=5949 RepID=A0A078B645_STYLE|nr:UNKNOWN [Stylonychia lemnae]|eukprot:CDW89696.1 UNKNOWN [Stylonychia lemnae]
MGNCIKIIRRLFTKSSKLAAILNKSRIFNTYEIIVEFCSIIFFNTVPSRTNQSLLIGMFTAQSFVCIIGHIAVTNACDDIWTYYKKIGEEAKAHGVCINVYIYYSMLIVVSVGMLVIRGFSLVYMGKSYRYLQKREAEKQRKRQRRIEKEKRLRKEKRRALQKLLQEQKNELFKKSDELIKEIEDRIKQQE